MKIKLNDREIFSLSEVQQQVIKNDIKEEEFQEEMERRAVYVLQHKYKQCFKRLKEEWEPKLKESGVKSLPLDEEEFAQLVFSQPSYMSRSQRDANERE